MAMLKIITIISILILSSVTAFAENELLNLKKLADALQFAHESLKVEDYTEAEEPLNIKLRNDIIIQNL